MEPRKDRTDVEGLEARVEELERLADALGAAPDEELVGMLGRAVALVSEINASVEAALRSAGEEARELEELAGRIDFGAFDAALADATASATAEDVADVADRRDLDEPGA